MIKTKKQVFQYTPTTKRQVKHIHIINTYYFSTQGSLFLLASSVSLFLEAELPEPEDPEPEDPEPELDPNIIFFFFVLN